MKIVFGIILMLASSSLLAAFQNQFSVGYQSEDKVGRDSARLNLNYLYLFSPVENESVPYAEEVFVSQSDLLRFSIAKNEIDYVEDAFSGDSAQTKVNIYSVNGVYYFPDTAFYFGLGYQQSDSSLKVRDANGDGFVEFTGGPSFLEISDGTSEKINLQLGYYINAKSRVEVFLSQENIESDLGLLGVDIEFGFYGVGYKQLFEVNETFFSLSASLGLEKVEANSVEFGNLGLDEERKKASFFINYYVNKATRVSAGVLIINNEFLDDNTTDVILGIEHYFNERAFASIGYFDSESNGSDGYNVNVGYRF